MKKNLCYFAIIIAFSFSLISCSKSKTIDVLPPATNKGVWIEKSLLPVPNLGRTRAVALEIGNYGYVGLGAYSTVSSNIFKDLNDFWRYDPSNDSWTEIAQLNVKNGARIGAFAFNIGDTAYVGGGYNSDSSGLLHDFYAYIPESNEWIRKADLPSAIVYATGFSINGKGYAGTGAGIVNASGNVTGGSLSTFFQYDPTKDEWQTINNYPGSTRLGAMSFVYNNIAYIIGGRTIKTGNYKDVFPDDFYSFNGTDWKELRPINDNIAREMGAAIVINDKAYITGGDNVTAVQSTTWAYNINSDNWQQVASYNGSNATTGIVGFSVNNKGYIGGGEQDSSHLTSSAFYEFVPDSTQ